ncbi:MAG: histidine phosphatase family protein [Candidatus Eremiobacteraeota bacterium]|nr:histidine phosphatase family protein [Candidatus Eremiobacteraeota bacterium]
MNNRYYLMRHGESRANQADKIISSPENGCAGYGLSDLGRAQAERQARESGLGPETRVICSDFLRTRETAEIAAAVLGCLPPVQDVRLRERHFGVWEGTSAAHYEPVWRRDQVDEGGDEVETPALLTERLRGLVEELEARESGQCFLLVSHGDPLRFLQLWALGRATREHQSIRHFAPAEVRALKDAPAPSARLDIGFLGLGNMGEAMAANLLRAGHRVTVWNRTPARADALVAAGARRAEQAWEAIPAGGLVFTMVSDDDALRQIADDRFHQQLGADGVHVSMSTISPALADELSGRTGTYLAAPVFGRPEAAAAAQLWICLAGAGEAKGRVTPVLRLLGQKIYDFGEKPSSANVVKLAGNFLLASAVASMAEAFAFVEKGSVERGAFYELITQTLFASPVYVGYGKRIADLNFQPAAVPPALIHKDLRLLLETAESGAVPMPIAAGIKQQLLTLLATAEREEDFSSLAELARKMSGLGAF